MAENSRVNNYVKCPFCPCIFLTAEDLQKHLACMGNGKDEHLECYRKTHGRVEHGSIGAE